MDARRLLCISGKSSGAHGCPPLPGWDVVNVHSVASARNALRERGFRIGLVVADGPPDVDELAGFLGAQRDMSWIGLFDSTTLDSPACRDLVAEYFHDFHTFPADPQRLSHTLGHALGWTALRSRRESGVAERAGPANCLSGKSPAIQTLRKHIAKIAKSRAPVLICGESGSGKELTANAVHAMSERAAGPFVALNCGAMPPALIQSELFGYEQGAFTGAAKARAGLIESAEGGTIFFDEIADLPLDQQANLLRFLQEGTIYRIGATRSIKVNARVVAASHVDLHTAVTAGRFREDLYYRLHVLPLQVPPLRERKADLADLAWHFFELYAHEKNPLLKGFSNSALAAITDYGWPGNVRELINRVRRAMVLAEGRLITPQDLGFKPPRLPNGDALGDTRVRAERQAICATLEQARYNVSQAARELGISRMTLYRLIAKHGIAMSP
ncbi:sigma-54 dependent transcriptional regulator [Massilia sp. PAMC28688]|uniref:sigma-54 dependent transcriptional regulator n=1 Tax=Massilia sp. PAMC28688 TaxID=2861283 RepID=UPI001C631B96|nr:sigma-54 dependent transcriptional regulator [Massilia sp. PAMC28688]QYF92127.1 sigma-54 dependent transcriptional regulator [Massilia sp. PAMC28688]